MSRIDTLSATLTVAVVLSIGFFIFQSMQEQESVPVSDMTKKLAAPQNQFPKVVLEREPARTRQATHPNQATTKTPESSAPILISTTAGTQPSVTTLPPKPDHSPDDPPTLDDVHFHFDRSGLSPETRVQLDHHAEVLKDPVWSVLIQGHTDREGTIQQNLRVGLHRAKAVAQYLHDHGVASDQTQVISLGEYQPLCTDLTPECRHQNRRVSFSLIRRNLPKDHPSTLTASIQSNPVPSSMNEDPVDGSSETVSPGIIQKPEPSTTRDPSEKQGVSLASLSADQTFVEPKRTFPLPVEPIIPGPVHSTPPPTTPTSPENTGNE